MTAIEHCYNTTEHGMATKHAWLKLQLKKGEDGESVHVERAPGYITPRAITPASRHARLPTRLRLIITHASCMPPRNEERLSSTHAYFLLPACTLRSTSTRG